MTTVKVRATNKCAWIVLYSHLDFELVTSVVTEPSLIAGHWYTFFLGMFWNRCFEGNTWKPLLVLHNYASIQQSSWNRISQSSVRHASVCGNLSHGFLSNFSCCLPRTGRFSIKKTKHIFSVFVSIGTPVEWTFQTLLFLQITAESFQTSPEFSSQASLNGPHLTTFRIFENNFNDILFVIVFVFSLALVYVRVKMLKCFSSYDGDFF